MTLIHEREIDFQAPAGRFSQAFAAVWLSAFRAIRQWHLDAVRRRTASKLPEHLQLDIGEIDHMPTRMPDFGESGPASYQDRLQQMWLR